MGLFDKKSIFDKLLNGYNSLSDEEKAKFKESITEKMPEENTASEESPAEEVKEGTEPEAETEATETEEPAEQPEMEDENQAESTPAVEEQPAEESVEEVAEEGEKEQELENGMEARLKALEEKFETILAEKNEEGSKDFGVSGFGKTETENLEGDNRQNDIIRKLGGRAR